MKLLKSILFFVLVQTTFFLSAQEKKADMTFSVNEIDIKAESIEELKTIDWEDLLSVFEDNTAKDSIRVGIGVKDLTLIKKNGESILINSMRVMASDITENKDELKKQVQENTAYLIRVLEKMTR